MSDNQFEQIVELLKKFDNSITGVLAFTIFLLLTTIAIFLVVFFAYYDKEQDRKRKQDDAHIKRVIEEYNRDSKM